MAIAVRVAAAGARGGDVARVRPFGDDLLIILADGAGNSSAGATAALAAVNDIERRAENLAAGERLEPRTWAELLCGCDWDLERSGSGGETTLVVAYVTAEGVAGASAGDSEAWLGTRDGHSALTENQSRKPLVGSGQAVPVSFARTWTTGWVLVASDGLFKYVPRERIAEIARSGGSVEIAADALIAAPRLASGDLPDDVSVVLLRR